VGLDELRQTQRAQPVGLGGQHVAALELEDLGAAATHLDDHAAGLGQSGLGPQQRLDRQIGQAVHLRVIDRLHPHARRDADPVEERQAVVCFPHGRGGDHAHLVGPIDLVFPEHLAVVLQNTRAGLDRGPGDRARGEAVPTEIDRPGERLERADLAVGVDLGHRHADGRGADVDHRHGGRGRGLGAGGQLGHGRSIDLQRARLQEAGREPR
jgi:hypothetical protein